MNVESYVLQGVELVGELLCRTDLVPAEPTLNTGSQYIGEAFQMRAYCWGDDGNEEDMTLPNFKCGDYEVTWYKHLRRGTESNRKMPIQEWITVMAKCMDEINRRSANE